MVSLSVRSPFRKEPYQIQIGTAESLNSVKQYLVSLGQLSQPLTCFSLKADGNEKTLDTLQSVEELGLKDDDVLEMVPEDYSLGELALHIQQTRELLGFTPENAPYPAINLGPTKVSFKNKKAPKQKERALTDAPDLPATMPILAYDGAVDLSVLVAKKNGATPEPIARTLHLSCWHPPTFADQLKGHLAYLKFVAADHKVFQITAAKDGFSVNSSTDDKFDASPKVDAHHISLLHLIGRVSPPTLAAVERMNSQLAKTAPQVWTQPATSFLNVPWLVDGSFEPHSDLAVGQKLFDKETLKDWNDEFQTTRELPKVDLEGKATIRDRIIREKLILTTTHDFSVAATKGALDILNGNMTAFNPTDPQENQIFLRNGIFYTFAFDSVGTYDGLGGDEAARAAALKDLRGCEHLITLDLERVTPVLTAIIDYCGRRIVAQGPVPGIFRENVEPDIIYGSTEGRVNVVASEEVQDQMTKIAESLHLKKHTAFNIDGGKTAELATSVSTKCMNGSDGRKYILDCARLSPVDIGFLQEHSEYPHQFALIRPEALTEWVRSKVRKEIEGLDKSNLDDSKILEYQSKFVLNPDAHLEAPAGLAEEYKKDREVLSEVSLFIKSMIIPKYVDDIVSGNTVYPIDGAQLTDGMHRRGISMRYLGAMYQAAVEHGNSDNLLDTISREAVSRAVKHLVNRRVRRLDLAGVHSRIVKTLASIESDSDLLPEVQKRFGFEPKKLFDRQLLREIALKLRLQLSADTLSAQKVEWSNIESKNLVCFTPIVRYATLQSAIPEEALNAGRASVQANKEDALDIITESLSLHEQVYGPVHIETGRAFNQASLVYHELQDYDTACELSRKAIAISERISGIDSTETIVFYINLGFYERARNNIEVSLGIHEHVLKLWTAVGSQNHPDMLNALQNVGSMLFHARFYKASIAWFEKAVALAELNDKPAAAPLYLQLSQAHVILNNAYATATRCAEKAFALYKSTKGPEDEGTKECKKWLDQLVNATVRDLKAQKIAIVPPPQQQKQPSGLNQRREKKKNVNDIVNYIMSDDNGNKKSKKKNKKKST